MTGLAAVPLAIQESIAGERIDGGHRAVLGRIKAVLAGEVAGFAWRLNAHTKESATRAARQRHVDEPRAGRCRQGIIAREFLRTIGHCQ